MSEHIGSTITDADKIDAAIRWLTHVNAGECTPTVGVSAAIELLRQTAPNEPRR